MPWNFQGGPTPRRPQELPPNWKMSPAFLLVMIDPSEAQDGAHEEIPSGTFTARGNSTLEVKAQGRALRVK